MQTNTQTTQKNCKRNICVLIGWTMAITIVETVGVREEVEYYNSLEDTTTHNLAKAMEMTAEEAVDYVRTKKVH